VHTACSVPSQVLSAAHTIVAIPYEDVDESGGYARTVVRALPIAVLHAASGVTEAVSFLMLGFRNSLQPAQKRDEDDRWA
jgi:autophagy-related protein 2